MAAPVGPKKVKRYSDEFKIQAVKLANHPEIQTQDVAHALDIHPFMLSKWKKDQSLEERFLCLAAIRCRGLTRQCSGRAASAALVHRPSRRPAADFGL
jgi:transposase